MMSPTVVLFHFPPSFDGTFFRLINLNILLSKRDCGATTAIIYSLSIKNEINEKVFFVGEGIDVSGIRWANEHELIVPTKKVHKFSNFFYYKKGNDIQEVLIRLKY